MVQINPNLPVHLTPPPICIYTFVLYICVSISAFKIRLFYIRFFRFHTYVLNTYFFLIGLNFLLFCVYFVMHAAYCYRPIHTQCAYSAGVCCVQIPVQWWCTVRECQGSADRCLILAVHVETFLRSKDLRFCLPLTYANLCPPCVPADSTPEMASHSASCKAAATVPFVLAGRPPADPLQRLQPVAAQGFEAGKLWS